MTKVEPFFARYFLIPMHLQSCQLCSAFVKPLEHKNINLRNKVLEKMKWQRSLHKQSTNVSLYDLSQTSVLQCAASALQNRDRIRMIYKRKGNLLIKRSNKIRTATASRKRIGNAGSWMMPVFDQQTRHDFRVIKITYHKILTHQNASRASWWEKESGCHKTFTEKVFISFHIVVTISITVKSSSPFQ